MMMGSMAHTDCSILHVSATSWSTNTKTRRLWQRVLWIRMVINVVGREGDAISIRM
jgi:hypothetical protein